MGLQKERTLLRTKAVTDSADLQCLPLAFEAPVGLQESGTLHSFVKGRKGDKIRVKRVEVA